MDDRARVRAFLDAASTGDVTTVDAYLCAGGDVNATLGEGWTALHGAVTRGHVRVLARLIRDAACDLNALTAVGTSALAMALRLHNNITTRMLLDGGASRATIGPDELRRIWDMAWLWDEVRQRLHPDWSIVWTPERDHRFSRQERAKARLLVQTNHAVAKQEEATHDTATSTVARLLVALVAPWQSKREELPSLHDCTWRYLPPAAMDLVLEFALFLW